MSRIDILPRHSARSAATHITARMNGIAGWAGFDARTGRKPESRLSAFRFQPASMFGVGCQYDVADEVFMALEFEFGVLAGHRGTIRYHPALRKSERRQS